MKKRRYIVLIFISLVCLGYLYFKATNTSSIDITTVPAVESIYADVLITSFLRNEKKANKKYKNQVLEIIGVIKEITFLNNRNTVLLQGKKTNSNVLFDMQIDQKKAVKRLKKGDSVKIKGICKGFLKDVIFLNGMLINTTTNE